LQRDSASRPFACFDRRSQVCFVSRSLLSPIFREAEVRGFSTGFCPRLSAQTSFSPRRQKLLGVVKFVHANRFPVAASTVVPAPLFADALQQWITFFRTGRHRSYLFPLSFRNSLWQTNALSSLAFVVRNSREEVFSNWRNSLLVALTSVTLHLSGFLRLIAAFLRSTFISPRIESLIRISAHVTFTYLVWNEGFPDSLLPSLSGTGHFCCRGRAPPSVLFLAVSFLLGPFLRGLPPLRSFPSNFHVKAPYLLTVFVLALLSSGHFRRRAWSTSSHPTFFP